MTDETYAELLNAIDESVRNLTPKEQANRLYGLIEPLLDRVERQDELLSDEQTMTTPEAVQGVRRAAAGESVDADAIFEQLAMVSLVEDQDRDLHVMGETAAVAAEWLRLLTGRDLRSTTFPDAETLVPTYAPTPFTRIVDILAWIRTGQMYSPWEDAATDPDYGDFPAAIRELREMRRRITT